MTLEKLRWAFLEWELPVRFLGMIDVSDPHDQSSFSSISPLVWEKASDFRDQHMEGNKELLHGAAHALCAEIETLLPAQWYPSGVNHSGWMISREGLKLSLYGDIRTKDDLKQFVYLNGLSRGQEEPVWTANFHTFGYGREDKEVRHSVEGLGSYDEALLGALEDSIAFLHRRIDRDIAFLTHLLNT